MRFDTLQQWLTWQEGLHPTNIELGLERIRLVWERLVDGRQDVRVITVAGTNGKGSCVAMLESILRAAGYRVGVYTSPHILRYNERVRICGQEASDQQLCDAFTRVDQARNGVSLTYFEFGTLAALNLFQCADLDVILLEVGLGGRLDAVNIMDADVALLTSVGIDHVEWLGPDRESIGREKAGIFRAGRPAVCADPQPPRTVVEVAAGLGTELHCIGKDFGYSQQVNGWQWWGSGVTYQALPWPALRGEIQLQNAAAVVMVLTLLLQHLPVTVEQIRRGLREVTLPGRFQVIPGAVTVILDVTHNQDGARVLAQNLRTLPCTGRTLAVVSMLQDKDVRQVGVTLHEEIDHWYVAGLEVIRGQSASALAASLQAGVDGITLTECASVADACRRVLLDARGGDRVVVFGSFHTVAESMQPGALWPSGQGDVPAAGVE